LRGERGGFLKKKIGAVRGIFGGWSGKRGKREKVSEKV